MKRSRLARAIPALAVMASVSALGQVPYARSAFSDVTAASGSVSFSHPATLEGECGGEPSIATDPAVYDPAEAEYDPAEYVYVTGWGPSDKSPGRCGYENAEQVAELPGMVYWVSSDGGATFGGRRFTGTVDHVLAQHSDVAVDARTGQVFVVGSEPFGAIYVCASNDHAGSFTTYPSSAEPCENDMNATGQFPALDRPWLTHRPPSRAHPHHDLFLVASSTGGLVANNVVWLSRDGGPWQPLGDPLIAGGAPPGTSTIVPAGQPAIAPNGDLVHVMLTQEPEKPDYVQVRLARLHNAGEPDQTWKLHTVDEFRCDSCVQSDIEPFALVAVDGDSNLYVLFVHDIPISGESGSDREFHPYLWSSTDHGQNWSEPKKLNDDDRARALPAMLAGTRAGQLMIGWYRSTDSADQCATSAAWHYEVVTSSDATSPNPQFQSTRLPNSDSLDDNDIVHKDIVHYGGIHTHASGCNVALGDFSSMAYDRHGCAVVAYADDNTGKIENNVARQTSGCFGDVD